MSDAVSKMVRLSSVSALFRSGGFQLDRSWRAVDLDTLTPQQIDTLRARYGRWIRVYPSDREALEAFLAALDAKPAEPVPSTTTTSPVLSTKAKSARKDG